VFGNIIHTYIGDLHVRVVSPGGVPVALHARTGGSADNIAGWHDAQLTPSEPLSRLRGGHALGTWTIEVEDGVPLNTGALGGWSVEVCGRPFETVLPPMRIRDVGRAGDGGAGDSYWLVSGVGPNGEGPVTEPWTLGTKSLHCPCAAFCVCS